jgi:hypothetical protein
VRVDTKSVPPFGFIANAVDLAMVNTAERHRELVAHFAAERARLRRAKVMGIRGLAATNKAGLRGNKLTMCFVADAPRFADRKHAFVNTAPEAADWVAVELASVLTGMVGRHRGGGGGWGRSQWAVSGSPIAEFCELCPEPCFDKFGVGGRQRVLGGQAPIGPAGRLVGGLKAVEFGDQPIP